jgi:hypothetical protein
MLFLSLSFPWSFDAWLFLLITESGVHTFNFGLALNVVFAEEVRVSVSFRSSLVCEISA